MAAAISALLMTFSCTPSQTEKGTGNERLYPEVKLTPGNVQVAKEKMETVARLSYEMDNAISSGVMSFPLSDSNRAVEQLWEALYDATSYIGALMSNDENEIYTPQFEFCLGLCYCELHYFWGSVPLWLDPFYNFFQLKLEPAEGIARYVSSVTNTGLNILEDGVSEEGKAFLNVSRMDYWMVLGQTALLAGGNENTQLANDCFKMIMDTCLLDLDDVSLGVFTGQSPAVSGSYADVLLHAACASLMLGNETEATYYYNIVLFSLGEIVHASVSIADILELRERISARLLGIRRLAGAEGTGYLPIPKSYSSQNPNLK